MTHLVGDPLTGWGRIERPCGHVKAVLVEEHPGVGPLARESPFVRELLDETADRRDGSVDFLVEPAIQPDVLGQAGGPYRGSALIVPRDHLGWDGHRNDFLARDGSAQYEAGADEGGAEREAELEAESVTQRHWCHAGKGFKAESRR